MCAEGLANPNFVYTDAPFTRTCQQAADFAESITRENICVAQMNSVIEQGCNCKNGSGATFKVDNGSSNNSDGATGITAMLSMVAAVTLALNSLLA